jgi:glucose/arabinose dehydrogenase
MRARAFLVAMVAGVGALAACSSGGSGTSSTSGRSGGRTTAATAASTTPAATSSVEPTTAPSTTAASGTVPATPDLGAVKVKLTEVVAAEEPIALVTRPGDPALYVARRPGTVHRLDGTTLSDPILDLTARIAAGGERGLLDIAFAPDGHHLYVHYTDKAGNTNLDEFVVRDDGTIEADSRRTVLTQQQPYPNHNGGEIEFGPDGKLYFGLGDGGSAGDPQRHALDLSTWLGKILRIDPAAAGGQPYTVPADNPFAGRAGAKPEIWSYGLRNPWRFTFDAENGDLWIGDVGQGDREEVDWVKAADGAGKGTDFGWSAFEGTNRYNDDQSPEGAVPPVFEYSHDDGSCSITGGYVYRGSAVPALRGAYLYADYCGSGVHAFDPAHPNDGRKISDGPEQIVSFGVDQAGEVYVMSFDGGVFRIDPA